MDPASERRRFWRRLVVAFVSYTLAIFPTYRFLLWLYPFSQRVAFWCVAIAVGITLPIMLIRTRQRWRELSALELR